MVYPSTVAAASNPAAAQARRSSERISISATIRHDTISRTSGLPGDHDDDVGNWLEPLGLASLLIEGIVVLLAVGRFAARRRAL